MVRRATEGTGSGSAAYQRIAKREEEARDALNVRIEAALDHIAREIGDLKTDVRRLEQGSSTLTNRVGDIERQVLETRDEVQKRAMTPAPSQIARTKTAITEAVKSPWGRLVAGAVGFVAVVSALNNTPDAVRAAERFWAFLAGRDVSALQVVVPPSPNPPISE